MAGTARNQARQIVAAYWKNEVPTYLTDGEVTSVMRSIQIVEGVVYIAGFEGMGGTDVRAVLWTNGIKTYLPEGGLAYGMCVSDKGDVYVVGLTGNSEPAIWKNGELTRLAGISGVAFSVAVSGDDVYAVGYVNDTPVMWKNGVQTTLADKGRANSIFIY